MTRRRLLHRHPLPPRARLPSAVPPARTAGACEEASRGKHDRHLRRREGAGQQPGEAEQGRPRRHRQPGFGEGGDGEGGQKQCGCV